MNETNQEAMLALPDDNGAHYAPSMDHSFLSSWRAIDISEHIWQFMHNVESSLSNLFWQGVSHLPKGYFAQEITSINYYDKSLWSGLFYEQLEILKEDLVSGSLNKADLAQELYQLQGLVAKYTLSPKDYEEGLDIIKQVLSENDEYIAVIEALRSEFRNELRVQEKILIECLEGDIISAFNSSIDLTGNVEIKLLKEILSYYKPLMDHQTYAKYLLWTEQCFKQQKLLPLVKYEIKEDPFLEPQSTLITKNKEDYFKLPGLKDLAKIIWDNKGKLLTLALASQGAMGAVLGSNMTSPNIISNNSLASNTSALLLLSNNSNVFHIDNNTETLKDPAQIPLYGSVTKLAEPQIISTNLSNTIKPEEIISRKKREVGTNWEDKFLDCHISNAKFINLKNKIDSERNNNGFRGKRAIYASPADICEISEQELRDSIERINQVVSGTLTSLEGAVPNYHANNCDGWVNSLRDSITYWLNKYIEQKQDVLLNTELRGKITTLENEFKKLEDKAQSASQTLKKVIGPLDDVISELTDQSTKCKKALRKEFDRRRELEVANCALKINAARITNAVKSFKDFRQLTDGTEDQQLISGIVNEAYNQLSYTSSLVDNIIKFISELPWLSHRTIGYSALYEKMQDQQKLNDPMIIVFKKKLEETRALPNTDSVKQECEQQLSALNTKLAQNVKNILTEWAKQIRDNNYSTIIEFARKYYTDFRLHLPTLVSDIYLNNLDHVDILLNFIRALPYIQDNAIAYPLLFNKMKDNNQLDSYQLVKLAYKVQEVMSWSNYHDISQGDKAKFEGIRWGLPPSIQALVWSGNDCIVKNREHTFVGRISTDPRTSLSTYLHAMHKEYDHERYYVANTYAIGKVFDPMGYSDTVDTTNWHKWSIKSNDKGNSFTIKNHNGRYLYAASDDFNYDQDRRRVFTWHERDTTVTQGYWQITPVNNAQFFTFKNTQHQEYLYADGRYHDSSVDFGHQVFTWRGGELKGKMIKESHWIINC